MKTTGSRLDLNLEQKNRWFVVANQTHATFYEEPGDQKFHFKERHNNDEARLHEGDLDSDRSGRSDSSAEVGSHSLDRRHHKHDEIVKKWAAKLVHHLTEASQKHSFEQLILVAEPHFLGILREELSPQLLKQVVAQIPKDYVRGSDTEIREHIFQNLAKM